MKIVVMYAAAALALDALSKQLTVGHLGNNSV